MHQTVPVVLSLSRRSVAALLASAALVLVLGVGASLVLASWLPIVATPALLASILIVGMLRSVSNELRALRAEHGQLRGALGSWGDAARPPVLQYRPGEPLDLLRRDLQRDLVSTAGLVASVDPSGPMPAPGGWAATPETLLSLVSWVLSAPRVGTILECGSGTSTAWLARAVQQRGQGRIVSLEHDPEFARSVRGRLEDLGLDAHVDVRDASMATVELDGEQWTWYDTATWSDLSDVTMLFVDGPLGALAPLARFPALPLLLDRLDPEALIVLDDIDRPDERAILDRWLALPSQRPLRVHRWTDRAVLLRFASEDPLSR